ncbi:MAG TPA: hypothetical protein VGL39_07610 [Jatrophihabitantaceae bacterium]
MTGTIDDVETMTEREAHEYVLLACGVPAAEAKALASNTAEIDNDTSTCIDVFDDGGDPLAVVYVTRFTDGTAWLALDMCVKYSGGNGRFGAEDARRIATALLDGVTLVEHRPAAS